MADYDVKYEACKDIAESTNNERKEAREIIDESVPTFIDKNKGSGTLVKTKLVRLDLQGQLNYNGMRYANLQIQLNKPRMEGEEEENEAMAEVDTTTDGFGKRSTTIAIVLMPSDKDIPKETMKMAFNGSLDNKVKAIIFEKKPTLTL